MANDLMLAQLMDGWMDGSSSRERKGGWDMAYRIGDLWGWRYANADEGE